MIRKFKDDFYDTRDEVLTDIIKNSYEWNKFINYWSKFFHSYSVDNILNLYSYNPNGKVFFTFDEWNGDNDRRIIAKSKGIPLLIDGFKNYVFDISQTYGKEYNMWRYTHNIDDELIDYYSIKNDYTITGTNKDEILYKIFNNNIESYMENNYNNFNDTKERFVNDLMTSLFLSRLNYNIYNYSNSYDYIKEMNFEDILECMQVVNKEINNFYKEFYYVVNDINVVQEKLKDIVIGQFDSKEYISNSDLQGILEAIEIDTGINYKYLHKQYEKLEDKYSHYYTDEELKEFKKGAIEEELILDLEEKLDIEKTKNDISILDTKKEKQRTNDSSQLSLFESREDELAKVMLNIFNSFDTKYKDTFNISKVELQRWEHIKSKKRNLTILLKSPLASNMGEDSFTYFNTDKTDEIKLNESIMRNKLLSELSKDKDFSISLTPTLIHIYWNNYDEKKYSLENINIYETIDIDIDDNNDKNISIKKEDILEENDSEYEVDYEEEYDDYGFEEIDDDKEESFERFNYKLPDSNEDKFSPKFKFSDNQNAITLLKDLENKKIVPTEKDFEDLSKYVGWGGISEAFNPVKTDWKPQFEILKKILTDDEYEKAKASTTSSFYTPTVVIDSMYKALERFGFKKGNILEPSCAIGNFFGRLPDELNESNLYGIEIDSISGRIAKQLYPNANIEIGAYQDCNIEDNFFDIAIGNVPFNNSPTFDKRYKEKFHIHDYFFQKTLDKVRSGGIIAFITSDGTLDKKDDKVRRYIAQRAEFIGAIRLPNNTFKSIANTKATTDIIFLKKRDSIIYDLDNEEWLQIGNYKDDIYINEYYLKNPEMMLGKMENDISYYGKKKTLNPINTPLKDLLENAVERLPENIYEVREYTDEEINSEYPKLKVTDNIKNNAFIIKQILGKEIIYYRNDTDLIPYKIQEGVVYKRIIGLCGVKNALREVINIQVNDGTDEELKSAQNRLNYVYDTFVKKYGYINSIANARAFETDPEYYLLSSIENKITKDDESIEYEKGDIFSKRTIRNKIEITSADSAEDALKYSLNNTGYVDLEYMEKLYSKDKETILEELGDMVFQDPEKIHNYNGGYVLASEYLSGNVKKKLDYAKLNNTDGIYDKQIKALEAVQPPLLDYDMINLKLGSTWIPEDIYHKFCMELLDLPYYYANKLSIKYVPEVNSYLFQAAGLYGYGVKNTSTWGTERADALAIIKNTLNLQSVTIYDEIDDRKKLNPIETANAREKQEMIKQEFKEWIWRDEARRERLVKIYNERFNCIREREYDGSHLTFDGMTPTITLMDYQKNAVARVLYGGNTLLDHAVGAGKTYECIASAMELKRLGLVSKPMFLVPNHLLGQWANEILKLYPNANVLVATQKDFEKKKRKLLMSRIATGEWDAVLIAHSSFGLIPMSKQYEEKYIRNEIDDVENAIIRVKQETNESLSVKKMEETKRRLETKLKTLLETKRDDIITFEELGIDFLIVDEAHMFKSLPVYSKMRNVAGVSNSESKKATDLYMKSRYILELNNGRGLLFATGTPISNSICEMFVMQKYLQYDRLKELGINNFDEWASTFGEIVNNYEITPDGAGFRVRSRFARFFNVPELMTIYREVADIKTAKMLNLDIPKLKNDDYITVVAPKSDELSEYIETLVERSANIQVGIDPRIDNMLKVTNDGRKAALDLRVISSHFKDYPDSKINLAVNNVFRIWRETSDKKSTQLVFCDLSTPKDEEFYFNVYDDMKTKLINKGIPSEEIEFIHNMKSDKDRVKLYEKVRKGNVRILFGSTFKMGAGMNVQNKLYALHHLDCPWKPSDFEQREGRILRRGNENPEVEIYRYVTEGSFDAYSYQIVQSKAEFLEQIGGDVNTLDRTVEDLDRESLSYAEVKAIASGNQLIMEKFKVENQLKELYLSKARYDKTHMELDKDYNVRLPDKIKYYENLLKNYKEDILCVKDLSADNFEITLLDKVYNNRKDACIKLYDLFGKLNTNSYTKIGEISGFDINGKLSFLNHQPIITLNKNAEYDIAITNTVEIGNILKMENALKSIESKIISTESDLNYTKEQLIATKEELDKPFKYSEKISELQKEKARIDMELDVDKVENILGYGDESDIEKSMEN